MDTKNLFFECLNNVPNEIHFEVDWAFEISNRIDSILKERRITQKEFAQMVGKRESEVCKWLKGTHNFTLRTLAIISAALNTPIITITAKEQHLEYIKKDYKQEMISVRCATPMYSIKPTTRKSKRSFKKFTPISNTSNSAIWKN